MTALRRTCSRISAFCVKRRRALKDVVKKRRYPSVSFAVESIVRNKIASEKTSKKSNKV